MSLTINLRHRLRFTEFAFLRPRQSVHADYALPHLVQRLPSTHKHCRVLLVPEIYFHLLVLQKMHLMLFSTADDLPTVELHEEVRSHCHHLLDIAIETVEPEQGVILINRHHVFEDQGHGLGVGRKGRKSVGDAFDCVNFVQPELTAIDEVSVCEVGYFEGVVLMAEE